MMAKMMKLYAPRPTCGKEIKVHFLEKVLAVLLADFINAGSSQGHTYLNEGEDQAHSEVGEPVDAAPHHEGGRTGGLQEDLSDKQRRDGTLGEEEEELTSLQAEHRGPGAPAVCKVVQGALGVWFQVGTVSLQDSGSCGEAV